MNDQSSGTMIVVSGELSAEDYVRAQYLDMRPRLVFKIIGGLILLLAAWAIWLIFFGNDDPFTISDLLLPGAITYFALCFFIYIPWKARRIYTQQKSMQRGLTMTFEEAGLAAKAEHGESNTPWPDFLKWKENDHLFLLYLSDALFIMIPKRMLSDAADEGRIRMTLLEKIGESKA